MKKIIIISCGMILGILVVLYIAALLYNPPDLVDSGLYEYVDYDGNSKFNIENYTVYERCTYLRSIGIGSKTYSYYIGLNKKSAVLFYTSPHKGPLRVAFPDWDEDIKNALNNYLAQISK